MQAVCFSLTCRFLLRGPSRLPSFYMGQLTEHCETKNE
jgi:hypothetical protein